MLRSIICPTRALRREAHYYNAKHSKLIDLGLQPHLLSDSLLDSMIGIALKYSDRIDSSVFLPNVNWRNANNNRNGNSGNGNGNGRLRTSAASLISSGV